MAQFTVQDVVQDVAGFINQDRTLPTSTELEAFVGYINNAQEKWEEAYDWDLLKNTSYIADNGGSLNAYFDKVLTHVYDQKTNPQTEYPVIKPEERYNKLETDKYAYVMGNPVAGYTLSVNAASLASLHFDWKARATALATLTQITTCPSKEYLATKAAAIILKSRSDTRFPAMEADAQMILSGLIANQDNNISKRQVGSWTRKAGYVIGEN